MPFRFEFDRNNRILRGLLEGRIGDVEIANFREEAAAMVRASHPNAVVVDLSRTEKYDISNAGVLGMAKSDPALPGLSIPVIIVAPAPHMFGASRVFQITSDEKRPWLHVVKSSEEAYEIIQVKSPVFEAVPADAEQRKKLWNR